MIVKYYKDDNLKYASRKRYVVITANPISTETQKKVLLGDGAQTQIKTSASNICDYVTIDDSRWFVTSYVYLNGGQVVLNLQRDVIGEFGLVGMFGKVERGYTDTILKNRKELDLNQILTERKYLKPTDYNRGNYTVNSNENELWGVLYLSKKYDDTGAALSDISINLPDVALNVSDLDVISNNYHSPGFFNARLCFIRFNLLTAVLYPGVGTASAVYDIRIIFSYTKSGGWAYNVSNSDITSRYTDGDTSSLSGYMLTIQASGSDGASSYVKNNLSTWGANVIKDLNYYIADTIGSSIVGGNNSYFTLPTVTNTNATISSDYDGAIVKYTEGEEITYYQYSAANYSTVYTGTIANGIGDYITTILSSLTISRTVGGYTYSYTKPTVSSSASPYRASSSLTETGSVYTRVEISSEEAGVLTINYTESLIDEPFEIIVTPLYNTTITNGTESYAILKSTAFNIFNNIIQAISGDSSALVDAQIVPYCPFLTSIAGAFNGQPFFAIASNNYEIDVPVNLYPLSDVKKEYIERQYSIVSPDQTGKFTFNFYDYITTQENNDSINESLGYDANAAQLDIKIKIALKPYSIIASAVIQPESGSLYNMTYSSDMRGCSPSANGFEVSLSSSAFETYKRQNSNYQQIFNLQKGQLQVEHATERVNEATSAVVNTIAATAFGAIAGKSMTDFMGMTGAAGAIAGGAAAGVATGAAMGVQYSQNEKLRDYEEKLQQENFDLQIGTIKNLPATVSRVSSFNEIMLKDFWFVVETYKCTDVEENIVSNFIANYGYGIGVYDDIYNYCKSGWFLRADVIKSNLAVNLHSIAHNELAGGIYYIEQE